MAKFESTCPSCGAPVVFRSSMSLMVVCEYCDSTVVRKGLDLSKVGKMGELAVDASPLYLGLEGCFREQDFVLLGRLQVEFGAGVWNEWFLRFVDEDKVGWLGEAQGEYMIYEQVEDPRETPSWDDLQVGDSLSLGRRNRVKTFTVTDKRVARCVSGEGELPFVVGTGYEFMYVDCRSTTMSVATLDYSEEPPLQFIGTWVDFDNLNLSEPRAFDDWS